MRVGITGHQYRKGIDWSWVAEAILSQLSGIPNLEGLSSLAAGADQVFANCVVERGGQLIAVIPFKNYREEFDPDEVGDFDSLLSRAKSVELDLRLQKETAYLRAGEWIVRHSDLMLAVWDGNVGGRGGTADIVQYASSLKRRIHHINPVTRAVSEG